MQNLLKKEFSKSFRSTFEDGPKSARYTNSSDSRKALISKRASFSSRKSKIGDEFDYTEDRIVEENNVLQKEDTSKHDIHFDKHADQKYKCRCNICEEESRKKKEKLDDRPESVFFKNFDFMACRDHGPIEKDFVFILKRLVPPKNMTNGLRINIPDTACFIQGECKFLVFTGKDKTLKYIKQKDKLTLPELRKYFDERRRRKDDIFPNYEGDADFFGPPHLLESKDSVRFDAVGETPLAMNISIRQPKKHLSFKTTLGENFISKEAGLVKFRDDSTTMLTELEFNNTILKRKIDPIWRQIQYLQSCVRTKKAMNTANRIYFVYDREKDTPLFKRALNEVKYLNGEILRVSEDYIPPQEELKFEEDMKVNNEKEYCLYILMKIHHFLEVIYGVKLLKMGGDFIVDELGTVWLLNISRVQYKQMEINFKEEGNLRQADGLLNYEPKDNFTQEVEGRYKDVEKKETIKLLNNIIKQHYENIKRIVGLDIPEAYYDDKITDEMFAKLHPTAPFKLSEILRSNLTYDEIRTFIVNNARKLLYPHSNMSQGMSSDLLAKHSYSGSLPKPIPGVVVKKSNDFRDKKKLPVVITDNSRLASSRIESSRKVLSTNQSIRRTHKGVKTNLSSQFTNTWWNLKPDVRDLYVHYNNSNIMGNMSSMPTVKALGRTMSTGTFALINLEGQVREEPPSASRLLLSNRESQSNIRPERSEPEANKLILKNILNEDANLTLKPSHSRKSRSESHMRRF